MIPLALASAFCFALASALHQRAAKQQPEHGVADPRLLLRLLRSRLWLSGWIPDSAAVTLQAAALRLGPLAVVQPLLASGLFMAVLIEGAMIRRRIASRDLLASAVGVVGLTAFLVLADAHAGVASPRPGAWVGPASCLVLLIVAGVLAAYRLTGAARGAALGISSGLAYSLAAALVKDVTGRFQGLDTLLSWRIPALAVVVTVGLLLNQTAFQHGRLAAPLTAVTLTDPVASVVLGVTVFQESLAVDPLRVVGIVLAGVTIAVGIWLAARSSAH
ncbi:DMT family transporter [Micromonospora endophytica]|uniref:Uncharacterized protein n=1 Tax=Micromonospora endophytica TaxID=515350 RepID=A0A2W2CKW1_9ACTN|nr:DMT family transporter [Micromonospora endophytica]PZG00122.1 hypothetical protein C1I93_03490 [Micromonospora endophytica]RIW42255.1 hypothetical protein D3H59_23580 [Micromonospora endophytica]BCJ61470.1 membrane protein [Micromonospora endophytica]